MERKWHLAPECVCVYVGRQCKNKKNKIERDVVMCSGAGLLLRVCVCVSAQVTGGAETAKTQRGH